MQAIGIDMSKNTFHAAFEDEKVLKFMNSREGIEAFMTLLEDCGYAFAETKIGVEATGVYHLLLAVTLTAHEWNVFVINPLESHRMITQGLRTVKTDRLDALKIRTMTALGKGYLFTDTKETLILKALVVERQSLVEMRKMTKQRMDVHRIKEEAMGTSYLDSLHDIETAVMQAIKGIEQDGSV